MKTKIVFFLITMVFFVPLISIAKTGEMEKTVAFFCADWNTHCKNIQKFFKDGGYYEKYNIIYFNFDKLENITLLEKIMNAKYDQKAAIPAVVIDSNILIGDDEIVEGFDSEIEKSKDGTIEFISNFGYVLVDDNKEARGVTSEEEMLSDQKAKAGKDENKNKKENIPFALVFFTALSDAINPCAFAVLMLLLGAILKSKGRRKALIYGIIFSSAIFVSYFLMGLGLYKALSIFENLKNLSIFLGFFAIILGIANLKDAFWYGKLFTAEMPVSWRNKAQGIIRHISGYPGALWAGIIMSLFLIPCAGGPYVIIIGLLAGNAGVSSALSVLFIYNLIFITPMIATAFILYFINMPQENGEKSMSIKTKRILHAFIGIILILVGIYLIK